MRWRPASLMAALSSPTCRTPNMPMPSCSTCNARNPASRKVNLRVSVRPNQFMNPALGRSFFKLGINGEPPVQEDDLLHRTIGVEELLRIAVQQAGEVLAVGADVPLGRQADALVDHPHAQAVEYVSRPVITGRETFEVGRLGALQAREGLLIGNETAGFVELPEGGGEIV